MAKSAHIRTVKTHVSNGGTAPEKKQRRIRTDRNGRKALQAFVDDSIAVAFKVVAAENLKTDSAMIHEAVGLLLRSYGKDIPSDLRSRLVNDGLYDHFSAAVKQPRL